MPSIPKLKMSIKPSSAFVVAVLLCSLLDPRDPQQVIVAQWLPPHPGPQPGAVKQEVEVIEERLQKKESVQKKQRCASPSTVIIGDEGKGRLKRSKGGSQEAGNDGIKNEKRPQMPQT